MRCSEANKGRRSREKNGDLQHHPPAPGKWRSSSASTLKNKRPVKKGGRCEEAKEKKERKSKRSTHWIGSSAFDPEKKKNKERNAAVNLLEKMK